MIRDPRYFVLSLVTFLKIWFSLRLVKTIDGLGSFFFLFYADTFVTQIVDIVMEQYTQYKSGHQRVNTSSDIEESETTLLVSNSTKKVEETQGS